MLTNPTIDMLRELGLSGMANAYHELEAQPEARQLEHGEWFTILLERETTTRRRSASRQRPVPRCSATTPRSRTSTSALPAASIATCS